MCSALCFSAPGRLGPRCFYKKIKNSALRTLQERGMEDLCPRVAAIKLALLLPPNAGRPVAIS
jgi:hypothetical protein